MVWSGVYPVNKNRPCDLCKSMKDVERKQIPINQSGCIQTAFTHAQSNLCLECKSKGWIEFGVEYHAKVRYYNTKNNEIKCPE